MQTRNLAVAVMAILWMFAITSPCHSQCMCWLDPSISDSGSGNTWDSDDCSSLEVFATGGGALSYASGSQGVQARNVPSGHKYICSFSYRASCSVESDEGTDWGAEGWAEIKGAAAYDLIYDGCGRDSGGGTSYDSESGIELYNNDTHEWDVWTWAECISDTGYVYAGAATHVSMTATYQ